MEKKTPAKFMNVSQLAAFLTISESAVWRLKQEGLPWLFAGNRVIFNPDAVVEWLTAKSEQQREERMGRAVDAVQSQE